jgi:putative flippase GtrA
VKEPFRFAIAGIANTLLSMGVFQLLLTFVGASIAYAASWATGILFAALTYPSIVFKYKQSWANGMVVIIVYLSVFVLGLLLLKALQTFPLNTRLAIFILLPATTIANYAGSRLALSWLSNRKGQWD